jgi:hypothetical protein
MNLGENMDLDALREYAEKLKGVMDNGDLDNFDYNELFKCEQFTTKYQKWYLNIHKYFYHQHHLILILQYHHM